MVAAARDLVSKSGLVGVLLISGEGLIEGANSTACDFLGQPPDELTGRPLSELSFIDEDGAPLDTRALTSKASDGARALGTYSITRADGMCRWARLEATADEQGILLTFIDVTGQRSAENKLRMSEARLWSYLDATPSMVLFADRDLKIQFINRCEPGYDLASVQGRLITDFLHPMDRDRIAGACRRAIEHGETSQLDVAPHEGVYTGWYAIDIGPMKQGGEIVGVIEILRDISDQVQMQSRLLAADRMAALGTLAASVAHEINNPLTYVLANAERVARRADQLPPDEPGERSSRELLAGVVEGAERIRNVVRDLSSLSRARSATAGPVAVPDVLESSIRMALAELRHRATLIRQIEPVPAVLADSSRLGQVFLNLLLNAAQSIPVGGASENEVRVSCSRSTRGWVLVEVQDTGVGIPAERLKEIFQPFVTTKAESGTGLGLYISHSIVESLGGCLTVESTPGEGTTFRVELPPAGEAVPHSASHAIAGRRATGPLGARILVVDDEKGVVEFIKDVLKDFDLTVAHGGRQALELLAAEQFDLVLCDLIMPDLSGMDVVAALRVANPTMLDKLVIMSGGAFTPAARQFIAESSLPLLEKPFSINELLAFVGAKLGRSVSA